MSIFTRLSENLLKLERHASGTTEWMNHENSPQPI